MRPVTQAFLRTLHGSHKPVVRARLLVEWQTGTNPTGEELPVIGGSVTLDATARIRSTLDLEIDGTGRWPTRSNLSLAPYGSEIYVEYGVEMVGTTPEWVGLGYFRIETIEQDEPPDGPIRITGSDRNTLIVKSVLATPRQYAAGTPYQTIVSDLVTEQYPQAVIEWEGDPGAIGRQLVAEGDRWAVLDSLISGLGMIWYWDHRGVLVVRHLPDARTPVWEITAGRDGVLVELRRRLSSLDVYNGVVVIGEAGDTGVPVQGAAYDLDPKSPTFWYGNFGKIVEVVSDPSITSVPQARAAAQTRLRKQIGLPYVIDFGLVPNPALEPWDPVLVRGHQRSGYEIHVLEQITIPLNTTGQMTATARQQRLVFTTT